MNDPAVRLQAVVNVLFKRMDRGASDEQLIAWLESLKVGAWKDRPGDIDGLIDAIKLSPNPQDVS